ncbi:hypothetical protein [Microcoleus sp. B5-D4]|uniref:hypothetical protein n=1 Tax=Microcoleus sp. B5-D4 TaxID=2818681 RepID=UPI002FD1110B
MPVPQRVNFLVEQASCVPQRVNFLVEQASCLFIKSLLRMVQHLSGVGRVYRTYLQALRLLANPPLRLIENGARYLLNALQNFLLLMVAKNRE